MHLALSDAFVAALLTCLVRTEKRGEHTQKVYMPNFTTYVSNAASQLIEQFCRLVQIWGPEELEPPSGNQKMIQNKKEN